MVGEADKPMEAGPPLTFAPAAWRPLGGPTNISTPPVSVARDANHPDVVLLTETECWHIGWSVDTDWGAWENLGGPDLYGMPALVSCSPDSLDIFARGTKAPVSYWHKRWDSGKGWQQWESMGKFLANPPTAISTAKDRIDVFGSDGSGECFHNSWDGTKWGGWKSRGGHLDNIDPIAALSWGPNRLDLISQGAEPTSPNKIWHQSWDGHSWSGWESLPGPVTEAAKLTATTLTSGRLDVFGLVGDSFRHSVCHIAWTGKWGQWEDLGGQLSGVDTGVTTCIATTNRLHVFASHELRGSGETLFKVWDGSSWSRWREGGPGWNSRISAVSRSQNRIDLFMIGDWKGRPQNICWTVSYEGEFTV
jgi:hypothetical protein